MKTKFYLMLLAGLGLVFNTCNKDEDEDGIPFEEAILHEALNEEEIEVLDKQESIELGVDDILLPNGLTVEEFLLNDGYKKSTEATNESPVNLKNRIIAKMSSTAVRLTTREDFVYPREGNHRPEQNGLAYSYGQREYTIREIPPGSEGTPPPNEEFCKEDSLYGLDCSGFIHQLFKQSGITYGLYGTADELRQPDRLTKAIKKKYPDFDELEISDLGLIPIDEFQTGDIIYWLKYNMKTQQTKAYHIGWIAYSPKLNTVAIAQSNGTAYVSGDCPGNYSDRRGPRFFNLAPALEPASEGGLGNDYGIIRIDINTDAPDVNYCGFSIQHLHTTYHRTKPLEDYVTDDDSFTPSTSFSNYNGEFNENGFTGSYTGDKDGVETSGSIKVYFSEKYTIVDSLIWTQNIKTGFGTSIYSCKLINLKQQEGGYFYYATGENSCIHIQSIKEKYTNAYDGSTTTLTSYQCTGETEVWITFDKQ